MNAIHTSRFLKNALLLDAAASGAIGVLHLVRPQAMMDLLKLPEPLVQGTGLFLAVYVLMLVGLAACRTLWRPLALSVVIGNVLWALASIDILVLGMVEPSPLGEAYVIAQALAVLGFAGLQYLGVKKSAPASVPAVAGTRIA
jgi:hypothetical protein